MGNDSLFGSDSHSDLSEFDGVQEARLCTCVPMPHTAGQDAREHIPGLHLFKALLPLELQEEILHAVLEEQALTSEHPQAMLFPRSSGRDVEACPPFLVPLVARLPELLDGLLPPDDYAKVFDETKPLQTILNLYEPGKGITPHIDLPHRYAEPIIGISLLASTVMDFHSTQDASVICVPIDAGDVYILLGPARYGFKHGIAARDHDVFLQEDGTSRMAQRGTRISITFRRMLQNVQVLHREA